MPDVLSPASGREAFTVLNDRILATAPNKARLIAMSEAARRGIELAGLLAGPDVARRVPFLEGAGFTPDVANDLRLASHALFYRASVREHAATATGAGPRVPIELWDAVLVLRRDLLDTLGFGLRTDAKAQEVLARVRPGNGYLDHAQDLATLGELAREHSALLAATMPGHFDPASADRAEALAAEMLEALGVTKDEAADDLDQRAWAFFRELFAEAHAALSFVWRKEPEALGRVPTLGTRGEAKRPRTVAGGVTPEAPPLGA